MSCGSVDSTYLKMNADILINLADLVQIMEIIGDFNSFGIIICEKRNKNNYVIINTYPLKYQY